MLNVLSVLSVVDVRCAGCAECPKCGMCSVGCVECSRLYWSLTPGRDSLIALLRHYGANRRRMDISHS